MWCFIGMLVLNAHKCPIAFIVSRCLDTHCIFKTLFKWPCVHLVQSFRLWQSISENASSTCTCPHPQRWTPTVTNRMAVSIFVRGPWGHVGEFVWDSCLQWHCWVTEYMTNIEFNQVLLSRMPAPVYKSSGIPIFTHPGHHLALSSFLIFANLGGVNEISLLFYFVVW